MSKLYAIPVPEVMCAACGSTIVSMLGDSLQLPEKTIPIKVSVDSVSEKKMAYVRVEEDSQDAVLEQEIGSALVENALYGATTYQVYTNDTQIELPDEQTAEKPITLLMHVLKGVGGIAAGVILMLVTMLSIALAPWLFYLLAFLGTVFTLYLGKDTYKEVFKSFWRNLLLLKKMFDARKDQCKYAEARKNFWNYRSLDMHALFAVSSLAALGVSIAAIFMPWLPTLFDVGLLIFGFRHLGEAIDKIGKRKVRPKRLSEDLPQTVEVLDQPTDVTGKQDQPCHDILPGSIIIVYAGQDCPINGVCLETESTWIDDTVKSGAGAEFPALLQENTPVLQGMKVPLSVPFIRIRTTAFFNQSYLVNQDRKLLFADMDAPVVKVADRLLRYFVPAVFFITTVAAIITPFVFPPSVAIHITVALLVSACPCTLGAIVPIAARVGLSKAAQAGVQFKSGESLQRAAEIDTVVLDLNGTLTQGKPRVKSSCFVGVEDPNQLLAICHAMEQGANHAFANGIRSYIEALHGNLGKQDSQFAEKQPHSGRVATVNGDQFILGNEHLLAEYGLSLEGYPKPVLLAGDHAIYIVKNNCIVGHFVLNDPLRPEAVSVVAQLKEMGKTVHLCTGASLETAQRYANEVGISLQHVHAGCKDADEKQRYIYQLQGHFQLHLLAPQQNIDAQSIKGNKIFLRQAGDKIRAFSWVKGVRQKDQDLNLVDLKLDAAALAKLQFPADAQTETVIMRSQDNVELIDAITSQLTGIDPKKARTRKVAMVGDAYNDANAMTACYGIAVRSPSSNEAVESKAQAVINDHSLQPLVNLFSIAQETVSHIRQSILFSIAYNVVAMFTPTVLFIGLGFMMNPALGVALMFLQSILILFNAYRIKIRPIKTEQLPAQTQPLILPPIHCSPFMRKWPPVPPVGYKYELRQRGDKQLHDQAANVDYAVAEATNWHSYTPSGQNLRF